LSALWLRGSQLEQSNDFRFGINRLEFLKQTIYYKKGIGFNELSY
jgi:hypothetical protein